MSDCECIVCHKKLPNIMEDPMTDSGRFREWFAPDFKEEVSDILGGAVTLRRGDGSGKFDELVAEGIYLHLEMMSDGQLYLSIQAPNSVGSFTMFFTAKGKLSVNAAEDTTP